MKLEKIINISAVLIILCGMMIIYGWINQNFYFTQLHTELPNTQYNAALCMIFLGLSFLLINANYTLSAKIICTCIGIFSLLTFLQYIFNFNLGIDTIFYPTFASKFTSHAGRMAPNTALCFMLASYSLFICANRINYPINTILVFVS